MRDSGSIKLYEYWDKLRGNRLAPKRSSIEPADIRSLLPYLFILEKSEDDDIVFRLAGTQICTLFGQEFRGQAFTEAWDRKSEDRIIDIVNRVLETGIPAVMAARAEKSDQKWVDIEITILPLASDLYDIDRLFGSIFVIDQKKSLLTEPIQKMVLVSNRVNLGEAAPQLSESHQTYDLDLAKTAAQKNTIGLFFQKVLHLRVFEGGKQE